MFSFSSFLVLVLVFLFFAFLCSSFDDINVLSFSFSISFSFLSSQLSDSNVLSVKIVPNKSLKKYNYSFCLGAHFLYFIISAFFVSFNVFKSFLANISLIVLFLILLTKSLMLIYLNSPILFL